MRFLRILMVLGSLVGVGCTYPGPGPGPGPGPDGGTPDLSRITDMTTDLSRPPADLLSGRNSGDCDSSRDCPMGACVELSPGGYRVCTAPVLPVSMCSASPELDQCCKTADCTSPGAQCQQWPLTPYCGGAFPIPHNVCASDECKNNSDCPGLAVCVPSGAFGYKNRQCLTVSCLRDSQCTAASGGQCVPIKDPCCGAIRGLFCVYPGSCRTNADCPSGYCEPAGARTQCKSGPPPCPP